MPTTEQLRAKLVEKLKEVFQLDEPALDFGFYRIMHAKAQEVQDFLENDLLRMVNDEFQEADAVSMKRLHEAWQAKLEEARAFGVENPEGSAPVRQAKEKLDAAKDTSTAEAEVYDHLYRFFSRYYDDGDFISLRYYSRENSNKAAPYAIPYNGEEVKLHWANSDQYYTKTTEDFSDFCVILDKESADDALPVQRAQQLSLFNSSQPSSTISEKLRLHFKVRSGTEGEHGNIKTERDNERFFRCYQDEPVGFTDTDELIIYFRFEPDTAKQGTSGKWQGELNRQTEQRVISELERLAGKDKNKATIAAKYLARLKAVPDAQNHPDRTVLGRYISRYTGRNTKDYFIHKDLGTFLRRELDFYLKNEVMRLDDIENADAPAVDGYLKKLRVMRRIAGKLITLLAQLEDFQKKLWLKKKFVVECNYCITLDRVSEELYPTIAANSAQWQEWKNLYGLEVGYGDVRFLHSHPYMMLDTRFFEAGFVAQLLAKIDDLDRSCDGVLIHSENFQALSFIQERYREQFKCIYIDPPYNTDSTPILYKNGYRHSSWNSLMVDRVVSSKQLLKINGVKIVAIDDTELINISKIIEDIFSNNRISRVTVVHNPKGSITKDFNRTHEYAIFVTNELDKKAIGRSQEKNTTPRKMRRWGENSKRLERPLSFYPIYIKDKIITRVGNTPSDGFHPESKNIHLPTGEIEIWPIDQDGVERRWNFGLDTIHDNIDRITIQKSDDGLYDLFLTHELTVPKTVWSGGEYDAGNYGNTLLINLFGTKLFDYPKSINLVSRCLRIVQRDIDKHYILDYFGGSGTTAHATINLNKEDSGNRKYILVEMGNHFNEVLKPRIQKVVYSNNWKAGKPQDTEGISHCFKYIRLESYEDTLNNLTLSRTPEQTKALGANANLREDYMLRYFLDVESKGSQSLLNIDAFRDPRSYKLLVKKAAANEYAQTNVDLVETFNWLIGLRVDHIDAPQLLTAEFMREADPEVPESQETRLVLKGGLRQVRGEGDNIWWFRKIEGRIPADRFAPNNGDEERALVVWRTLSGDLEKDNAVLEAWFEKNRISPKEQEFDVIYVNGSNTLPNIRRDDEHWKVVLIEEEFFKRMWEVE